MNSAPVSANDLEGTSLTLWAEFLASYFDGNAHAVGSVSPPVTFPQAALRFQESPLPQPLGAAVGISVVWIAPSRICLQWDTLTSVEIAAITAAGGTPPASGRQQRATAHCAWLFLVRAVTEGSTTDDAQKQVQAAAGKLHGLLQNSGATVALAAKGIHHVRPGTPRLAWPGDGALSADLGFKLRVLSVAGQLRYPILSQ